MWCSKDKELDVFSSKNRQWNDNHDCTDSSQPEKTDWGVENFIVQGDAIYDYERTPAWNCFDEQPTVYQYGDTSVWQNNSSNNDDSDVSKIAS